MRTYLSRAHRQLSFVSMLSLSPTARPEGTNFNGSVSLLFRCLSGRGLGQKNNDLLFAKKEKEKKEEEETRVPAKRTVRGSMKVISSMVVRGDEDM